MRNCSRDDGGPFEIGNQVLVSSHRKLLRDGGIVPYDSERFIATTKAEAAAKAQKWAMTTVGAIVDKTWLHVTLDGAAVYSKELRGAVMREAPKSRSAPPR
jgi:hypothetical protein